MSESMVGRYWCHMCSRRVSPVMELEIKCPNCDGGFVEEMDGSGELDSAAASDLDTNGTSSLLAPILLGMLGGALGNQRSRREEEGNGTDSDNDLELLSMLQRSRRSSGLIQLLEMLQDRHNERRRRERGQVILINPFNDAIILQGSFDQTNSNNRDYGGIAGSLEDYFTGDGLDLLLQHLAESDPNRYGTPPAQKEAVEAMPTVKVEDGMSCSVCLEDFRIGSEAKEMPCKHRFHGECILPWLELHSTCPVCRFQMPVNGSKDPSGVSNVRTREASSGASEGGGDSSGGNRSFWMQIPWPFSGLFSFSSSRSDGNSAATSSPSSSTGGSNSHANEN